jgi:glycosyltransferase involved in cell wall biosynthesis
MSKKVALIGAGPLPVYAGQASMGPGIRTWQFASSLARDGHRLLLITFEFAVGKGWDYEKPRYSEDLESIGKIEHISFPEPDAEDYEKLISKIRTKIEDWKPDCIVSAGTFFTARVAASLDLSHPLWIDFFGHSMSEIQAKVNRSDREEAEFFKFLYMAQLRSLRRGDRFSALSHPQKMAAIGELSLAGRLNPDNLGVDLVSVIPCGFDGDKPVEHRKNVLRNVKVSPEDFVVLWTGGFNSWVDDETLFEGLLQAMSREETIRWVGLGGGIGGHFQKGYQEFRSKAESSGYRDRFLFLEWIPTDQVPDYYFESDIGINVDLPIYEALLGGRNRIVGWMAAGLPVLTTEITEISRQIKEHRLGFTIPVNNAQVLGDTLVDLAHQREQLKEVGQRAREFAHNHLNFRVTTEPLLSWVSEPLKAPDLLNYSNKGFAGLNSLEQLLEDHVRFLEGQGKEQKGKSWVGRLKQRVKRD